MVAIAANQPVMLTATTPGGTIAWAFESEANARAAPRTRHIDLNVFISTTGGQLSASIVGWLRDPGPANLVRSMVLSPDGRQAALAYQRSSDVLLCDLPRGNEEVLVVPVPVASTAPAPMPKNATKLSGHRHWVEALAFSPDGKLLASAGRDNSIRIWNVTEKRELATLVGHSDCVNAVAFSGSGGRLASGSADGSVKIWDLTTSQELLTLEGHTNGVADVAFSPDGTMLVSASSGQHGRGELILWFAPHAPHTPNTADVAESVAR